MKIVVMAKPMVKQRNVKTKYWPFSGRISPNPIVVIEMKVKYNEVKQVIFGSQRLMTNDPANKQIKKTKLNMIDSDSRLKSLR